MAHPLHKKLLIDTGLVKLTLSHRLEDCHGLYPWDDFTSTPLSIVLPTSPQPKTVRCVILVFLWYTISTSSHYLFAWGEVHISGGAFRRGCSWRTRLCCSGRRLCQQLNIIVSNACSSLGTMQEKWRARLRQPFLSNVWTDPYRSDASPWCGGNGTKWVQDDYIPNIVNNLIHFLVFFLQSHLSRFPPDEFCQW